MNSTRIYKWVVGNDTIQADTLTYHLDDLGGQVADLNDTLHVSAMDTSFNVTLVFQRFFIYRERGSYGVPFRCAGI